MNGSSPKTGLHDRAPVARSRRSNPVHAGAERHHSFTQPAPAPPPPCPPLHACSHRMRVRNGAPSRNEQAESQKSRRHLPRARPPAATCNARINPPLEHRRAPQSHHLRQPLQRPWPPDTRAHPGRKTTPRYQTHRRRNTRNEQRQPDKTCGRGPTAQGGQRDPSSPAPPRRQAVSRCHGRHPRRRNDRPNLPRKHTADLCRPPAESGRCRQRPPDGTGHTGT